MKMGVALLTNTPSDPLAKTLLPGPATLCFSGVEVFVPEGGILIPGETVMISLHWKLRMSPDHTGILMPLNQRAKKGIMVSARVIDPVY